jgi:hypothetical protein
MHTATPSAHRFNPETAATKRLYAVALKAFLDILFICVVVTYTAFRNYSPLLRGAIDEANQQHVAGWAHDPLAPTESLEVQLFIDGAFIAARRANERRDDLVRAGATRLPLHGYRFDLAQIRLTSGPHTAQVYAVRAAGGGSQMLLPLSRKPLAFHVAR